MTFIGRIDASSAMMSNPSGADERVEALDAVLPAPDLPAAAMRLGVKTREMQASVVRCARAGPRT